MKNVIASKTPSTKKLVEHFLSKTMDPFDHLKKGDVDYFKGVVLDVLENSRDENNDTLFSKAAILKKLDCCREICSRCPSLIWHQNCFLNTALHHAIYYGASIKFVEFLIAAVKAESGGDLERGQKWLAIQNYEGDTALHYAVIQRNIEATRILMEADSDHEVSRLANSKKTTPLHLAVEHQNFELVKILAVSQPDFEYCANNDGETPVLMAMRQALSRDSAAVKIRKLLIEMQPNQCKVSTGDKGWTALHHAAYKGDLDAIEDIIKFCPDCTEMVDNEGWNFLHIAAKFDHVKLVKYVLETKEISASILNGQDHHGYTPLHLAAEGGNKNMVCCFLYDSRVTKTTRNAKGEKVLDAITFDYDKEKAGVYGVRDRVNEQELKDQSDFDLVVGALIATVSFTAGITVPGGYISDGDKQGMAVLAKKISFEVFVISNNFALVFSLYAVFSHFCTRRLLRKEDITYQLNVATFCTLSAIFAMMVAFITGSYAVLAISNRLAIVVAVNSCCFFIFAFRALWRMAMQYPMFYSLMPERVKIFCKCT